MKEVEQEATKIKMKESFWTKESMICICGHHYEFHYTEGDKTGCRLCKECGEFFSNAFYADSMYADEILERI